MNASTLLITGASGQLGRRVAELVLDAGHRRLVLLTRTPAKLADLAARGATVRAADFDDPGSLAAAFAGADRLLLVSTDSLDQPGKRIAQHRNAIAAAVQAGVRHVVYTSVAKAAPDSVALVTPDHLATEQALAGSPLSWTILRNNLYTENLLASLPPALASGQLYSAAGDGAIAYITRDDCARVAAAALLADDQSRRILEVGGPEALTQTQVAALASRITGRPVAHIPVSAADLRAGLAGAGLPPFIAEMLVSFDLAAARGELDLVTTTVADLTGRAPARVADFLAAHLAKPGPAHA